MFALPENVCHSSDIPINKGQQMKQGTTLEATQLFNMKPEAGRKITVKPGDLFSVTNPEHMQHLGIKIARYKTARLNEGYLLECDQIGQLFKAIES